MAVIQMTPELLNEKAREIRRLREEHDGVIRNMDTLIHGLDAIWKGESQAAYIAKFESMSQTFLNFSEMIEQYAVLMDNSARQLQEADAGAAHHIG